MNSNSVTHSGTQHCCPDYTVYPSNVWHGFYLRLLAAKGFISLFVAVSALTGYVVQARQLDITALLVSAGIMLLAAGSATLNNVQDRRLDRRFSRTCNRPLACGALSAIQGKRQSAVLITAGCLLLYLAPHGSLLLLLGLIAAVCYNVLYTPFKIQSLWAVIPGVACGMIPPLVGWISAGGQLWSPRIWLIMLLLGLWQPPHAWLILLANADEFRAAGLRSILSLFSTIQVRRILFVWVCSFVLLVVLLPFFGILRHSIFSLALILAGALVALCYARGLFITRSYNTNRHLFTLLNGMLALTMLYCILDNLLASTFI